MIYFVFDDITQLERKLSRIYTRYTHSKKNTFEILFYYYSFNRSSLAVPRTEDKRVN